MAKYVLLNNIDHQQLRVRVEYSSDYAANVNTVPVFPTEFASIQCEYPIFFQKNEKTGEFQSIALLGFARGENLFLDGSGWSAHYVPSLIAKGPFLIGFQEVNGEQSPVIHIDLDDVRVNAEQGAALFLEQGGNSPYLERIASILQAIHEGVNLSGAMFAAYERFGLIESVAIDVTIDAEQTYSINNFYTINTDRLASLGGPELEQLNRDGWLQGAFLVAASLGNLHKLVEMKRKQVE